MTMEKFFTRRWNNLIALGLGIPALAYLLFVLSTTILSGREGFIGLVIVGSLF